MKTLILAIVMLASDLSFGAYQIKVFNLVSKEEKTYKIKDLEESFKIPFPFGKTVCSFSQDGSWKKESGGAGLTCTRDGSDLGFSVYVNCSDQPALATQILVPVKEGREFAKKNNIKLSKKDLLAIAPSDLLMNLVSIRIGCGVIME